MNPGKAGIGGERLLFEGIFDDFVICCERGLQLIHRTLKVGDIGVQDHGVDDSIPAQQLRGTIWRISRYFGPSPAVAWINGDIRRRESRPPIVFCGEFQDSQNYQHNYQCD